MAGKAMAGNDVCDADGWRKMEDEQLTTTQHNLRTIPARWFSKPARSIQYNHNHSQGARIGYDILIGKMEFGWIRIVVRR